MQIAIASNLEYVLFASVCQYGSLTGYDRVHFPRPEIDNDFYDENTEQWPLLVEQGNARAAFDRMDRTRKKVQFYPLGGTRDYGNLQATCAPTWLKTKIQQINEGLNTMFNTNRDVLSCNNFQIYNGIKTTLRPTPQQFEVGQGIYSACLPVASISGAGNSAWTRDRVTANKAEVRLKTQHKIKDAEETGRFYLRVEPIYSIDLSAIPRRDRTWS